MYIYETQVRVRYGETDQMGYAYYGVYPLYYEMGRTDMLRTLGVTYKEMEARGIFLPVLSLNIKYIKPAYYDDMLTIKTILRRIPLLKLEFEYEIYNEENELLNIGDTTLVFIDAKTRKPAKAPDDFLEKIKIFFNQKDE
ncbi:MAG: acyl-CoA thioesterase [Bacteroidales bacterium]|nr:acyl-CoA thioesterase [Bacteroidales bacterium]